MVEHNRTSRLQARISELVKQWELLSERLSKLEKQRLLETRSEEKLRMLHIIKDDRAELQELEHQIEELQAELEKTPENGQPGESKNTANAITEAEKFYREKIADRCNIVPLRGVNPAPGTTAARQHPLNLAQIYIQLDTRYQVPVKSIEQALQQFAEGKTPGLPVRGEREQDEEIRSLSVLEAVLLNRQFVLLGDPGSGKTTFVKHLTYALACQDWQCLSEWPESERNALPILITLRDFAQWLKSQNIEKVDANLLWRFIENDLESQTIEQAADVLKSALNNGHATAGKTRIIVQRRRRYSIATLGSAERRRRFTSLKKPTGRSQTRFQ